jgi:hypothetical protein
MIKEDDIKSKIFNTIHMNKTKRKYFRIEKNKLPYSKDNKSKAIFKTKKEYNFLNRKTLREEDNQKSKNNKFVTTTIDDTTASVLSENSFVVQNIIPKKLVVKEKKEVKNLNNLPCFSKMEENILFVNNENKSNNIYIDNYRMKLMYVYFSSIQNLCKYINNNLFIIKVNESKNIDEFLYQIYQDLQILNRKIYIFKFYESVKDNIQLSQEDFKDIINLKNNLLLMKNLLKNNMSQNLINIYMSIDNFCKVYSS